MTALYIENLNLRSFLLCLRTKKYFSNIYYIDKSMFGSFYIYFFIFIFSAKVQELKFRLLEIIDNNNELIRLKLDRKILFDMQDKILTTEVFKDLCKLNQNHKFKKFILREIMGLSIKDEYSLIRALYLIEVINSFSKNFYEKSLILNNKKWIHLLDEYASNYKIKLFISNNFLVPRNIIINKLLSRFPKTHNLIFNLIFSIRHKKYNSNFPNQNNNIKIFIYGRGDINLKKNGHNSDFSFVINSQLNNKNIIYDAISKREVDTLIKNKINILKGPYRFIQDKLNKIQLLNYPIYHEEAKLINSSVEKYKRQYKQWASIFYKHNVKVLLNWQRFSSDHVAMTNAINDQGGISALWQLAFNGTPFWDSQAKGDLFFCFSKFSVSNEIANKSEVKYYIISGIPNDYSSSHLKIEANKIRKRLYKNGVKKIICVFDEGGSFDNRWHSGMELQQENYSRIIIEMLKRKELGLIFKPKSPKLLKKRLGNVYQLVEEAVKTGRCKLIDNIDRYQSSVPVTLAGLASDLVVHTDLSAGTAAIECASLGKPVLLIDREGFPFSKLNDLPLGKVRFKNWDETIVAINEFNPKNHNNLIGNWGDFINELDPFRDGLSANRIGTYLKWIVEGYEKKENPDKIMEIAAEKYGKIWGKDKIIN